MKSSETKANSLITGFLAAAFYVTVSISMTFFNKAVLSAFKFGFPLSILATQLLITVCVLLVLNAASIIKLPPFSIKLAKTLFPVSCCYSLNVAIALTALSKLNVPMYGTLKRMAVLVVLAGEYIVLKKSASSATIQSVLVIAFGALVAGLGDLEFDLYGYLLVGCSCLSQACYLLFVKKIKNETVISTMTLLFYNSLLSLPFVVVLAFFNGDFKGVPEFDQLWDPQFQIMLLVSLCMGLVLNYSIFLCTAVNSPLTLVVSGQLKAVIQTVLGLFILGGVKVTTLNLVGLAINTSGGFWYSYEKYRQSNQPSTNEAPDSNHKV